MRTLKKTLALVLVLAMMFSLCITASADFTDADEITYVEAAEVLAAIGVIEGMPDGSFDANGTLTRAQAATMIVRLLGDEDLAVAAEAKFDDVAANHWAAAAIAYCANEGIIAGYGDGKFGPSDELTGYQWAKMLLVALGFDAEDYTGSAWQIAVAKDAAAAGIFAGNEKADKTAAAAREEAALYALNGLNYSISGKVTYTVAGSTLVFTDLTTALLAAGGDAAKVTMNAPKDTLLNEVHKVAKTDSADEFGRVATRYANAKWTADLVFAEAADYTITLTKAYTQLDKLVEDIIKATGVKKMNADEAIATGAVYLDGKPVTGGAAAVQSAMADAAKAGTVIELYVAADGKTVENIVAYVTYADTVATVTEANEKTETKASITLTNASGLATIYTDKFAKDDVVLYNKAWNGTNYSVTSIAKAESVTGAISSFTNLGVYTIGGKTYVAGGQPVAGFSFGSIDGKDYVWHLDNLGNVIYKTNVAGEAPVVLTDYAKVLDTVLVAEKDAWLNTIAVKAQIKAVLSNGETGVYNFDVYKATAGENKGQWVYKLGAAEVVVANTDSVDALQALENGIYTYTVADGKIALAAQVGVLTGDFTKDAAAWHYINADVKKGSTTVGTHANVDVIVNDSTVFVLKTATGTVAKTGVAALEGTTVPSGSVAIVNVDVNEKDTSKKTYVAAVVFAEGTTFTQTSAVDTKDYIYVAGGYTTTMDETGSPVYTYEAVKADGTKIAVTGAANVDEGIYIVKSDNSIGTKVSDAEVVVGTIAGTTVQLGSDYKTVPATALTVVVAEDAAFVTGAKVMYVTDTNGAVALIYVTEAAPQA